jgi:hypothetical protein
MALNTQGGRGMLELGDFGSVRGVPIPGVPAAIRGRILPVTGMLPGSVERPVAVQAACRTGADGILSGGQVRVIANRSLFPITTWFLDLISRLW